MVQWQRRRGQLVQRPKAMQAMMQMVKFDKAKLEAAAREP
jgi:hypothetical protein